MAIVDLGTSDLFVGGGSMTFGTLDYQQNRAYALYLTFTSDNFANIFSFLRVTPEITPSGGTTRRLSHYTDIPITPEPQIFLFACSPLFDGNGDASFIVERRSFVIGTGDRPSLSLNITYDDSNFTGTWL